MPGVKSSSIGSTCLSAIQKAASPCLLRGRLHQLKGISQLSSSAVLTRSTSRRSRSRCSPAASSMSATRPAAGAIINATMARRCWPGVNPVGKRFGGDGKTWITVVGVIADMHQTSLGDEPDMEAYLPYVEMPQAAMAVVIRTTLDPLHLASGLRSAVRGLDKELPVSEIGTLTGSIAHSTREQRFTVALLGGFASLALVLAAVGIYGVISYTVTCRIREIGVRMALGAGPPAIIGMVVKRALLMAGAGVAVGVAGGLALTRLMRSMLFGVSATDPAVFIGVALLLLAVSALAGYLPARRAARVNPLVALRHE